MRSNNQVASVDLNMDLYSDILDISINHLKYFVENRRDMSSHSHCLPQTRHSYSY